MVGCYGFAGFACFLLSFADIESSFGGAIGFEQLLGKQLVKLLYGLGIMALILEDNAQFKLCVDGFGVLGILAQELIDHLVGRFIFVCALVALKQLPHRVLSQVAGDLRRVEHAFVGACGLQVVVQRILVIPHAPIGVGRMRARSMFLHEPRDSLQ